MKKKLLRLSTKIDDSKIAVFEAISEITKTLEIPFFVIGAAARDLILENFYGIITGRATLDIDFGIRVSILKEFEAIKNELLTSWGFSETNIIHRVQSDGGILVDILPFGDLARDDFTIRFSDTDQKEMSVLGFDEGLQSSILVRIKSNPNLDIKVASPAGYAVLKLIAWNDRYDITDKDGQDFFVLINNYVEAGNLERYVDNLESFEFEAEETDYSLAGAQLLGRDIAQLCKKNTLDLIITLLESETNNEGSYKLAIIMAEGGASFTTIENNILLLEHLLRGIRYQLSRNIN